MKSFAFRLSGPDQVAKGISKIKNISLHPNALASDVWILGRGEGGR